MGRHSRPEPAGERPASAAGSRTGALLAVLAVVVAAAVAVTVALNRGTDQSSAQVATTPTAAAQTPGSPSPEPSTPTPSDPPTPTASSTPSPSATPTPAATPTASTPPPLLAFTVVQTAWISVTDSTGRQLVARVWRPGEKAMYDGPAFTVRTGNAGGVRFVVQGKPQPVGRAGQVVSFTVRR